MSDAHAQTLMLIILLMLLAYKLGVRLRRSYKVWGIYGTDRYIKFSRGDRRYISWDSSCILWYKNYSYYLFRRDYQPLRCCDHVVECDDVYDVMELLRQYGLKHLRHAFPEEYGKRVE